MSKVNKSSINLTSDYENLKKTVEDYINNLDQTDEEIIYTASLFLNWLSTKTNLVSNEDQFSKPDKINIRRGSVVWVDFGFNVGEEFGGKHPAVILRVSGKKVFVAPLSSQKPKNPQLPMYVKVGPNDVKRFKKIERWINVLNITGVSIQRIDFSSIPGSIKGSILDDISEAIKIAGIK